ncbi:MAG TPA: M3 family metallopeptidase [Woeseiaceae bacterium]|nr:M3 family metallopeptidase [Woeseiaceae bacterium]
MSNPLRDTSALPRFAHVKPEHALPAVTGLIAEHRQKLERLLADGDARDFEPFVVPLEDMHHELARVWSPIAHLQAVLEDPDWRDAYNACLPVLTEHGTELAQNKSVQQRFSDIMQQLPADAPDAQRVLLEKGLRDFHLAGVALPDSEKKEFRKAMQELAAVQAKFEQNLQDSTDNWHFHTEDESVVKGLPTPALERAKAEAARQGLRGWRLSLDYPTWQAVITHADNRELRERFYHAWSTRASDQGGFERWDNGGNIEKILSLRHRLAGIVGFENYAEYSLATKMAAKPADVIDFLDELAARTRPSAVKELDAVQALAPEPLAAWDVTYWLERLKQQRFSLSDEELRQYFPAKKVVEGLFAVAATLYGVTLSRRSDVETWHETVEFYDLSDDRGAVIGGFYTDLYARNGKRGGAWIDECVVRKNLGGEVVLPAGYLVCNFSPPNDGGVSLLTHRDVVTLFHEFGHMLHHLLTRVDYPSLAGINGVPWDAVELPSQFMENYAWSFEVLERASGHWRTGEPLPRELFERLESSRHFGAALAMLRQLEFALFDFRLHAQYDPRKGADALNVLDRVRGDVALVRHPDYNRLPHSFSHIFAGGYAAGYYSYKWAEVLAADAFAAFEEAGIFDRSTARRFRAEILEIGGSRDIMEAYIAFRGRKPTLDALLRQSGIIGKAA